MQFEHTEHKDEGLMTDVQFLEYKRVRDELEAAKREALCAIPRLFAESPLGFVSDRLVCSEH